MLTGAVGQASGRPWLTSARPPVPKEARTPEERELHPAPLCSLKQVLGPGASHPGGRQEGEEGMLLQPLTASRKGRCSRLDPTALKTRTEDSSYVTPPTQ